MTKPRRIRTKPDPGGRGVGRLCKTSLKLLRPEQVWQPRMGAPRGNRNAAKPLSTMKARLRDLKRRIRAALNTVP
jgi:hypothetical protein